MSFNLNRKLAEKSMDQWDQLIEKMLEEHAEKYDMGNYVTEEAFLERQRTGVPDPKITENALEEKRTSKNATLPEHRFENEKSLYNNHRVDAFTGSEKPKLEEKRLSRDDVMEDEEYESAAE
jgi:hypothetical protein